MSNKGAIPRKTNAKLDARHSDGYSFGDFGTNAYKYLNSDLRGLQGVQQLIQMYYFNNGTVTARQTAYRINKLLQSNEGK